MTDAELVLLARQGQPDAFDQLVTRHHAAAYRAALAALRSPPDAEEATQDAVVRAWTRLDPVCGAPSLRAPLLTIAWNCALSRRRSLTRWLRRHAALDEASAVAADARRDAVFDDELRRHAAAAIERLSPRLRDALLLAQSGEYDYAAIADMLKIPVGTLKWRVSEARKKVRAHLGALGYVEGGRR